MLTALEHTYHLKWEDALKVKRLHGGGMKRTGCIGLKS